MTATETQDSAKPPIGGRPTMKQAAEMMNVSVRSAERASFVRRYGIPELRQEILAGNLKLGPAEIIAKMPHDRQLAALQEALRPAKRTRPKRTILADCDKIFAELNKLSGRWSDDDCREMCRALRYYANSLEASCKADESEVDTVVETEVPV